MASQQTADRHREDSYVDVAAASHLAVPDVLSSEEIQNYQRQGLSESDIDRKRRHRQQEMEVILQKFTNADSLNLQPHSPPLKELNIVVFGKQEDGKCTVADLLLGDYQRLSQVDFQGLTVQPPGGEPRQAYIDGRMIRVLDLDAGIWASQAKARVLSAFPEGVHALLYVWNIGKRRFAGDDRSFLADYQEVFHSGITEYCITVLSSSYEQSPMRKQSLVEFQRQSQQPKSSHLEQFMFQQILGRVLAIELGNEPNYFAFRQRQNLLSYIDRLMTERENEPFVPQMKCMELCYNAGAGVISSVSRAVRSWFQ